MSVNAVTVYTDAFSDNISLSDHSVLPRIVLDIWESRPDLRVRFPDPFAVKSSSVFSKKTNMKDFKSWLFNHGFHEYLGLGHFYQFYVLRQGCSYREPTFSNRTAVAVILPTMGNLSHLERSLYSLANQRHTNWKLYLIDGSETPSRTKDYAEEVLGSSAFVHIVEDISETLVLEERVAAARNIGMKCSTEELIAHLDDDNKWHIDHLSKLVAPFEDDPTLGMCFSLHRCINPDTKHCHEDPVRLAHNAFQPYSLERLLAANFIASDDVVLRRTVFQEIGGFRQDLPFYADWEYWCRIAARFPVLQIYELLTDYYIHADSITALLSDSRYISKQHASVRSTVQKYQYADTRAVGNET